MINLPRKRRKDARPAELLSAALALFVERGYAATRLEDVAARAGVSKGTLYLYYSSKAALFQAVIQEGIVPVIAENEEIAAQHEGSSFSLLEKMLANWWNRIGKTEYAGIPKLVIAEAINFPEIGAFYYEKVIARGRSLIGSALKRGMDSGEFRSQNIDLTIDILIAPVLMLLIWRFSFSQFQPQETDAGAYLQQHLEMMQRALCTAQV